MSARDKCLHLVFLINLLIMVGCAVATIMCFLSDKGQINKLPKNKVELTIEEIITLACGVTFFVAFFIAMTVEIKARHTLYKLFLKFVTQNTDWAVESYDRSKDPGYSGPASPVWGPLPQGTVCEHKRRAGVVGWTWLMGDHSIYYLNKPSLKFRTLTRKPVICIIFALFFQNGSHFLHIFLLCTVLTFLFSHNEWFVLQLKSCSIFPWLPLSCLNKVFLFFKWHIGIFFKAIMNDPIHLRWIPHGIDKLIIISGFFSTYISHTFWI